MREETQPNEQFLEDWLLRDVELVDKYQPQLFWFDWWIEQPAFEPYIRRFAAYYYNAAARWQRGVVVNHKWTAFRPGAAVYDIERGALADIRPDFWQNDTAVSKTSWSWVEGHQYKSVPELVAELIDVVAKNGALLLNIGPKPDGTIPPQERALLQGIGDWLTVYGEAIYGTRPWRVAGEGPTEQTEGSFVDHDRAPYTAQDVRFTVRTGVTGTDLYAIVLARPDDGHVLVRSLGTGSGLCVERFADVRVLGHRGEVTWRRDTDGLHLRMPARLPGDHAFAIRVRLEPRQLPPRTDELHELRE